MFYKLSLDFREWNDIGKLIDKGHVLFAEKTCQLPKPKDLGLLRDH